MREKIAIIDYGLGNMHSIHKALEYLGVQTVFDVDGTSILSAERVILPGVGAFSVGVKNLRSCNQFKAIRDFALSERPFLGICLGCQMLLPSSEEFGGSEGLGLIPGKVVKIPKTKEPIPHTGWKALRLKHSLSDTNFPFPSITEGVCTYFAHSYHVRPETDDYIRATCEYGDSEVAAIICKGNIFGFQFHPEKSGEIGLEMLRDFLYL